MEERIKAELEKDPDAIEEDIRKKVLMERQTRKAGGELNDTMNTTSARRDFRAPAITLGTVMGTTQQ